MTNYRASEGFLLMVFGTNGVAAISSQYLKTYVYLDVPVCMNHEI